MDGSGSGSSTQSHRLNPGDTMRFHNHQSSPLRIRVTTECGTQTETELHPGAVFTLKVGNAPANVDMLPPEDEYTGLKSVD
jgi:hypothetical protein